MSQLTIFTAPKPFTNTHITTIQQNAIVSWKQLGDAVDIVLLGGDPGIGQAAAELGVHHIPDVRCNGQGTPIISSMFDLTRQAYPSPIYMIINTDILLFPGIVDSIQSVKQQADHFLVVGQRWDLDITTRLDFSRGWEARLKSEVEQKGKLHPRGGSDYFIFPSSCYPSIPDFAIGRAGWDNWMIYEARRKGWRVIDATEDIQIVHQNHDYSHLPDGKPHYKLPETFENVRLAGGSRTIFTLMDTDTVLAHDKLSKHGWEWSKLWREVEIFPLLRLKSYVLAQAFYAVFHPVRAYWEVRTWLGKLLKRN
jgi:hypothetical protein